MSKRGYSFLPAPVVGVWTPKLVGISTAGTPTYTLQEGSYEWIGRVVNCRFNLVVSALTGIAGNVEISGLPYPNTAALNDSGICFIAAMAGIALDTGFATLAGLIAPAASSIVLTESGSGLAAQGIAIDAFTAPVTLVGWCQYHTDVVPPSGN